jgi:hypothetical protein
MRNGVDLGELVRSHGLQVVRERIAARANAVMRLHETQKVKRMGCRVCACSAAPN